VQRQEAGTERQPGHRASGKGLFGGVSSPPHSIDGGAQCGGWPPALRGSSLRGGHLGTQTSKTTLLLHLNHYLLSIYPRSTPSVFFLIKIRITVSSMLSLMDCYTHIAAAQIKQHRTLISCPQHLRRPKTHKSSYCLNLHIIEFACSSLSYSSPL
jgi:hypothetical protein